MVGLAVRQQERLTGGNRPPQRSMEPQSEEWKSALRHLLDWETKRYWASNRWQPGKTGNMGRCTGRVPAARSGRRSWVQIPPVPPGRKPKTVFLYYSPIPRERSVSNADRKSHLPFDFLVHMSARLVHQRVRVVPGGVHHTILYFFISNAPATRPGHRKTATPARAAENSLRNLVMLKLYTICSLLSRRCPYGRL